MKMVILINGVLLICFSAFVAWMLWMPGRSAPGFEEVSPETVKLSQELQRHVEVLASEIGPRSLYLPHRLAEARDYIRQEWTKYGLDVERQEFEVSELKAENLFVRLKNAPSEAEWIIVGAHYDSVGMDCPAANDNASGVAAILELGRMLKDKQLKRPVQLVAFVNEEPPFFHTQDMGSLRFAKKLKSSSDNIHGMLSLETIGYFSDQPKSQKYPWPLNFAFPDKGNFIAFVSNLRSSGFLREVLSAFREKKSVPSEGIAAPSFLPGISWSDHWSFWQAGYPAVMVTDTAPYRYPHYHLNTDTPDKIDYQKMAQVVQRIFEIL